ELERQLAGGESVWAQAVVAQWKWYDYFQPTYGYLATTNRRLLFTGVSPPGLIDDPAQLPIVVLATYPHFQAPVLHPGRVFFGRRRGVAVELAGEREEYGVAEAGEDRLTAVVRTARALISAYAEAARRETQWRDSIAALGPVVETYTARPGDALSLIAERYETSVERLRELNSLTGDRVLIGQRLVVRITPRAPVPCPPERCDPERIAER
ncbi:MAG: LysM peptidoglycan-binding domain-containing protein, partial [Gemmatimonadaceae bacterium]